MKLFSKFFLIFTLPLLFMASCEFMDDTPDVSQYVDDGLLYVNLQSQNYVAQPASPECRESRDYPSAECIRQSRCYGLKAAALETCIAELIAAGPDAWGPTTETSEDDDDDHDGEDGDDVKNQADLKFKVQIESVQVRRNPDSAWITISDLDDDDEMVDLANDNLNERIAAKELPAGPYSDIRINLGDNNFILQRAMTTPPSENGKGKKKGHDKEENGDDEKDNGNAYGHGQEKSTGFIRSNLVFPEGVSHSVVFSREFQVDAVELLEVFLTINIGESVHYENGVYYFTPVGYMKHIEGGGYRQPDQPIAVQLDNNTVLVEAPAGAVTEPVKIQATALTEAALPAPLPVVTEKMLTAYDFQPNMVFKKPVKLTLPYDPVQLQNQGLSEDSIEARYYNESIGEWITIPGTVVDTVNHTASFYTTHFTIIALGGNRGFRLQQADGMSVKVKYDFLNNLVKNILPLKLHELNISNSTKSYTSVLTGPNYYSWISDVTPRDLNIRDLKFQFSMDPASPNIVNVHVTENNTTSPVARVYSVLNYNFTSGCDIWSCYRACSIKYSWWDTLWGRDAGCRADCRRSYNSCLSQVGITTTTSDYRIKNVNLTLKFAVGHDPVTNNLSLTFLPAQTQKPSNRGVTPAGTTVWLDVYRTVVTITGRQASNINLDGLEKLNTLNDVVDLLDPQINLLGTEIETLINSSFADPSPTMINLTVASDGIQYEDEINLRMRLRAMNDATAVCATPVNLLIPVDVPTAIPSPVGANIGIHLSMNALEQLYTELANRQTFCYSSNLGPGAGNLDVTPIAAPQLVYMTNYMLQVSIPASATWTPAGGGAAVSQNGVIKYIYRLKPNIAARTLGFEFVRMNHDFTEPMLDAPLLIYHSTINSRAVSSPAYFSFDMVLPNVVSYGGFQKSMFRMDKLDLAGQDLNFEYKVEGLKQNGLPSSNEWIWYNYPLPVANQGTATDPCTPMVSGTLVTANQLQFANGVTLPVQNLQVDALGRPVAVEAIPANIFNSLVGTATDLQGRCVGNVFYAQNVINQHFYTTNNGKVALQGRSSERMLNNFVNTVGAYKMNLDGMGNRVLQVIKDAAGNWQLTWYLDDPCCTTTPTQMNTATLPVPASIQAEGLYRVSIVPHTPGDQLLLNCNLYDVSMGTGVVTLTNPVNLCMIDEPGLVKDYTNSIMWSRCSIGQLMYDPACSGPHQGFQHYPEALNACSGLDLGGYNDWNLPAFSKFNQQIVSPATALDSVVYPNSDGEYWATNAGSARYCYTYQTKHKKCTLWILWCWEYKTYYKTHTSCSYYPTRGVSTFSPYGHTNRLEYYRHYTSYQPYNKTVPYRNVGPNYYLRRKTRCYRPF